ncbi:hypothetical protein Tco_1285148 [Tanacetum coccineum]
MGKIHSHKVNVFSWPRALRDRLPTRVILAVEVLCLGFHLLSSLYAVAMEDVQHCCFFRCEVGWVVLRKHLSLVGFVIGGYLFFLGLGCLVLILSTFFPSQVYFRRCFYVAWWRIWRLRNQLVFDASPPNRSTIFDDIVS